MFDLRRQRAHCPVKAHDLLGLRRVGIMASLSHRLEPEVSAALATAPSISCVCPPILARSGHRMIIRQRSNTVLNVDAPLGCGSRPY